MQDVTKMKICAIIVGVFASVVIGNRHDGGPVIPRPIAQIVNNEPQASNKVAQTAVPTLQMQAQQHVGSCHSEIRQAAHDFCLWGILTASGHPDADYFKDMAKKDIGDCGNDNLLLALRVGGDSGYHMTEMQPPINVDSVFEFCDSYVKRRI